MKRISELISEYKSNPTPETAENILKILGQLENPSALDEFFLDNIEWIVFSDRIKAKQIGKNIYAVLESFLFGSEKLLSFYYEIDLQNYNQKQIMEYVKNCPEFSKASDNYNLAAAAAIAAATPEKRAKEVYISKTNNNT